MIAPIEQNISPVTALPGLLAVNRPAAVNQLVEEELPLLSTELETLIGQVNNFATQTNQTALEVEANKDLAAQSAVVATSLANFQGTWSNIVTYSKGQSVESTAGSKMYYVSKVDSNLNNAVTDTNYWLPNPINNKSDKNISTYTDKSIPIDADLIPLSDSVASFEARKLTWANLKATLISSFGSLINGLTAKTTPINADMIIIADSASTNASKKVTFANLKAMIFTDSNLTGTPTAPTATVGANTTQVATTAFVKNEIPNALNASGTAPIYACRAWVNFNGTGTVAIRASGNVSSITDNGVGDYTVNFTTAMVDANYSAIVSSVNISGFKYNYGAKTNFATSNLSGSFRFAGGVIDSNYATLLDADIMCINIFR